MFTPRKIEHRQHQFQQKMDDTADNIQRGMDSPVTSADVMETELMKLLSDCKVAKGKARLNSVVSKHPTYVKILKNGQSVADYFPMEKRFMFYMAFGEALKLRLLNLYGIEFFINGFTHRDESANKLKSIIEKKLNIEIDGFLI